MSNDRDGGLSGFIKYQRATKKTVGQSVVEFIVALHEAMRQPARTESIFVAWHKELSQPARPETVAEEDPRRNRGGRAPGSSGVKTQKLYACYDTFRVAGKNHKAAVDATAEKFLGGSKVGYKNFCISLERGLKRRENSKQDTLENRRHSGKKDDTLE
jgi:hypothetical protein